MSKIPALICGAGPVGLTMAAQLLRQGIGFRIVDKNSRRSIHSKALVVWARSLEVLNTAVPAQDFIDAGIPVRKAEYWFQQERLAEIDFSGAESPFGTGVMIPQDETERVLEESLARHEIHVERQTELKQFEQNATGVRCQLAKADGTMEELDVSWLIGCDGAHSVVRHQLELPFHGELDRHRWYLADVHIRGEMPDANVVICGHPDGIMICFQIRGNRWRIIAEVDLTDPDQPVEEVKLSQVQEMMNQRGPSGFELADPIWLSEFRINERKVDRYGVGRAFLVGDAAHIHSPAGGQGMNTGMQDACNLAWKLALVEKGVAGQPLLESYTQERSVIGEQVLKAAGRLTDVATLRNSLAISLRNIALKTATSFHWIQKRARDTLSELRINYASSPLCGAHISHGAVRPGFRVPDLHWQTNDGQTESLFAEMKDPSLLLLTWQMGPEFTESLFEALPARWRDDVRIVSLLQTDDDDFDADGIMPASEWKRLGSEVPGYALLRPDGYLALSAKANEPHALQEWCAKLS